MAQRDKNRHELPDHGRHELKLAEAGGAYRVRVQRQSAKGTLRRKSESEVARSQAVRNAAARAELVAEFGLLSGAQIAAQAQRGGNGAAEPGASPLGRWKRAGRVFTVRQGLRSLFPAYQFDSLGRPRPVIAEVLSSLGQENPGWAIALWFTSSNGWLGGKRPVDLLDTDPSAVSEAARREAFETFF